MKILYIANARLPTEKAHGIQIMKTCEAFADLGHSVSLIVPRRFNFIKDDPFEYYRVKRNFKIIKLPTIDLVKFSKIGFWIESIVFAKMTFLYGIIHFLKKTFFGKRIPDDIILS
ncbi:MAG: group 1 glycosyl transferase [Parcubacteria group bacterium GW2011_GWE2_40_8]|nr:MAG: group 1 glycosyl transferase [Parcubacteria group bacterium GW2011_GWE2_40_8]